MELRINQKAYQVDAEADTPLLWVIRDNLGMTGTKYGCGLAQCGACSVLVDGNVVRVSISTFSAAISTPSKMICPLVGFSNKFRQRKKVDFPEPLGPIILTTSP